MELFLIKNLWMRSEQQFDFIIAGAGAAGLTLLWYMLRSKKLSDKKILLLDKSLKPTDSKTWCFWSDENHPASHLIHHTWKELDVVTENGLITDSLKKINYHCIRSIDYSTEILNMAAAHPQVTFIETEILGFSGSDELGFAKTKEGIFSAQSVFQSALLPPDFHQSKCDLSLLQHFMGWEIKVNRTMFNPEKALFMDFNVPQKDGPTFFYLLPYARDKALVEYTLFSPATFPSEVYEAELKSYLFERYGLTENHYSVTRKESGAVPMEDRRYSSQYSERVWNIGTTGGYTKATTGYTFSRIHDRCQEIVRALEEERPIPEHPISSYRFRVYDIMMLYLLEREPEQAVKLLGQLFKRNSFENVLRFLNEETSLSEELAIFKKFSYMPFFRSFWKMKYRIFTGA
jgi:lycopene beta-cyclase